MGCIDTKLSKKRRRERKRLGLQEVKQFLKSKKGKHTKQATKIIPVQRSPIESDGSVIRTVSNTTYTIDSDDFESPTESNYCADRIKDSSMEYVSDHDSLSISSCSIYSLDVIKNGDTSKSQKHPITHYLAEGTGDNNEFDKSDVIRRPDIDKSPPPYLLPGFIDELDNDLEEVISDKIPKSNFFINFEENKNSLVRPKAAKGARTPHCINNSKVMKTSTTFSLPGSVDELDDEIEKLIGGTSSSVNETRNQGYMPHPTPTKRVTNAGNNHTARIKAELKQLNDEIESLIDGNNTALRGLGMSRPKAAKGKRTIHTTFTDYDNYNLPGTVMPSTSHQLPNRNTSLPSFSPQRSQLTVKEVNSHQSNFFDTWKERQRK